MIKFSNWLESTNEMTAFLQVIINSPEDDNARLIFADWLEEHDLMPGLLSFLRTSEGDIFSYTLYEDRHYGNEKESGRKVFNQPIAWADLVNMLKEGEYRPYYPSSITKANASGELETKPEYNDDGTSVSYSISIKLRNGQQVPSLIMWIILKSAHIA